MNASLKAGKMKNEFLKGAFIEMASTGPSVNDSETTGFPFTAWMKPLQTWRGIKFTIFNIFPSIHPTLALEIASFDCFSSSQHMMLTSQRSVCYFCLMCL